MEKNIKSIVFNVEGNKCVVKTLLVNTEGNLVVKTDDVLITDDNQKLLCGQEVSLKDISQTTNYTRYGGYSPYKIEATEPARKGDLADQQKRLDNLKEMCEVSMLTDPAEQFKSKDLANYSLYEKREEFSGLYYSMVRGYGDAVSNVIKESFSVDKDGDYVTTEEEEDKYEEVNDIIYPLTVNIMRVNHLDYFQQVKEINDYCSSKQPIRNLFNAANEAIQLSHDIKNENNNSNNL